MFVNYVSKNGAFTPLRIIGTIGNARHTDVGTATVVFPEAGTDRCTAALLLEADGRGFQADQLNPYVSDRPYAASSLLAA